MCLMDGEGVTRRRCFSRLGILAGWLEKCLSPSGWRMNEASVRRVSGRAVVGENLALRPARHDPIAVLDAWARNLAAQDLKLLTQNQDLDILGTIPPPTQHEQFDQPAEDLIYTAHDQSLPTPTLHPRTPRSAARPNFRHPQGQFDLGG